MFTARAFIRQLLNFQKKPNISSKLRVRQTQLSCCEAKEIFNIFPNKGLIKRGSDADIVILDMNKKWTVDRNTLVSKGKNCAHLYFGEKIKGKINKTIVNGNVVYDGKKFYKNKNMNNFVSPIRKN